MSVRLATPMEAREMEYFAQVFAALGKLAKWGSNEIPNNGDVLDLRTESGFRVVPVYNYGYRLEQCEPAA